MNAIMTLGFLIRAMPGGCHVTEHVNYWGGATGYDMTCACGLTNSCSNGQKCNCYEGGGRDAGRREDSGILTDKSVLPVTEIRIGDVDQSHEEAFHTLGKLKCYGVA